MDCEECKHSKTVSWSYVELLQDSYKRVIRWMAIFILVLLAVIAFGVYEWTQYDYEATDESISLTTRGGGDTNYIGNDGDITYGTDYGETQNQNP